MTKLLLAILVAFMPFAGNAQAESGPSQLPCRDPTSVLREAVFTLDIGTAHLHDGKDCLAKPGFSCDWSVTLRRTEEWGVHQRFLLVEIDADHVSGTGQWESVFVYRCQGDTYVSVFSNRFLYGAKVELGANSDFWLTTGVWRRNDPTCCPSVEQRRHYVWNNGQQRFVAAESSEKPLKVRK